MQIHIRYMAQLKQAAGTGSESIDFTSGSTVQELLTQLTKVHPDLQRMLFNDEQQIQPTILVFLGDDQVDNPQSTSLSEGDTITLLSPIAGGII